MPQYTTAHTTEQWKTQELFGIEYIEPSTSPRTPASPNIKGSLNHKSSSIMSGAYNPRYSVDTFRSTSQTLKSKKSWGNGIVSSSFSDLKRRRTQRKSSIDTASWSSPTISPVHYYKEAEAKDLLRTYLASSIKFDEALEFGFPIDPLSSPEEPPWRPVPVRKRVHNHNNDAQLFLRTGSFAFLSDPEDSDEDSGAEEDDSPSSPTLSSVGSAVATVRSTSLNFKPWDMGFGTWQGERQMTLRITLTKQGLRASDDEIYGISYPSHDDIEESESLYEPKDGEADPLALPSLHEYEATSAAEVHIPTTGRITARPKMKSLWQRMSRRDSLRRC